MLCIIALHVMTLSYIEMTSVGGLSPKHNCFSEVEDNKLTKRFQEFQLINVTRVDKRFQLFKLRQNTH